MTEWKVLFLKPNTEKKVAEVCRLHGISHYLPVRIVKKRYQRRLVETALPVFRGYLFVRWLPESREHLQRTNHIVKILTPKSSFRMLRQLVQVRRALEICPTLEPGPRLEKGKKVKVTQGPLMGMEGLVARMSGKVKVVINIDMIGQSVSAVVDSKDLEIVG